MLVRWVEGRSLTADECREPRGIERIASLVRRIHALPPPTPARRVPASAWIARYEAMLGEDDRGAAGGVDRIAVRLPACARDLRREAAARLAALGALPAATPVLCHSDLHALNLIDAQGSLVALDWEYAHVAEAFWDLAGWSRCNDFAEEECRSLLAQYLGRPASLHESSRFDLLAWLYDYVCLLWSEIYLRCSPAVEQPILVRAELIASRLGSSAGGSGTQVPAD